MRYACHSFLILSLSGLSVTCVLAQRVPSLPAGLFNGFDVLLLNESVQAELKLTTDQLRQVKEFVRQTRLRRREEFEKKGYRTEERMDRARAMLQAVSGDTLQGVREYLKKPQVKRLEQIQVQWSGIEAFSNPEVEQSLRLGREQKQQIQQISRQLQESASKLVQEGARTGFSDKLQKMTRLRQEAVAKAVAHLSAEQRRTWAEIVGEPFQPPVPSSIRRFDGGREESAIQPRQ